jgi:hypothetical protein
MKHLFGLRSHKLAVAAALSLALVIPLISSYFYLGAAGYIWRISGSPSQGERNLAIGNQCGITGISLDDSPGGQIAIGSSVMRRGDFFCWAWPSKDRWDYFRMTFWSIGYNSRSIPGRYRGQTDTGVYFPAWMLLLLCTISPFLWLRRWWKQRINRLPGHCPTCGYDLRATPDASAGLLPRCPECGENFSA